MNAFISWSGSRELLIARAIKEWLAAVVPGVRAFISPDLPKGQAWFDALATELKDAQLAFMCLAPPRVASEWQLVEAGAIWKAAASGGMFPLCFGIRATDVPEPLRTFQLTHFDKEDFERLAVAVAKLTGGFGGGGLYASRWETSLVSIQTQLPQPILEYYWEGRHPNEPQLFGGKGRVEFTIGASGHVTQGTGDFKDVCMDEARPPTTKLADLQRATPQETAIMNGNDEREKRALADRKLQDWP
jgi:hypothetical protein